MVWTELLQSLFSKRIGTVILEWRRMKVQWACPTSSKWKIIYFALFIPLWSLSSPWGFLICTLCITYGLPSQISKDIWENLAGSVSNLNQCCFSLQTRISPWKLGWRHMCLLFGSLGSHSFAPADQNQGDHQIICWDGTSSSRNMWLILIAQLFNVPGYS